MLFLKSINQLIFQNLQKLKTGSISRLFGSKFFSRSFSKNAYFPSLPVAAISRKILEISERIEKHCSLCFHLYIQIIFLVFFCILQFLQVLNSDITRKIWSLKKPFRLKKFRNFILVKIPLFLDDRKSHFADSWISGKLKQARSLAKYAFPGKTCRDK